MLTVENLHVRYGQIEILHGVSLHVGESEVVAVLGANGAGKSTLIKTIIGWLNPVQGTCKLDHESLDSLPAWERVKRGIAIVPETGRLFRDLSVEDNLRLGAYLCAEKDTQKQMEVVFNLFPVLAERRKQIAKTLSGGEQQMLAIGRAMMSNPRLLLIDEVSMGLMPILVKRVFKVIQELPQHNVSVLLVEQNAFEALKIVNRAYVLENGHIILEGKAQELTDSALVKAAYLGG